MSSVMNFHDEKDDRTPVSEKNQLKITFLKNGQSSEDD